VIHTTLSPAKAGAQIAAAGCIERPAGFRLVRALGPGLRRGERNKERPLA
jgi:hypothetical protein